MKAVILAAGMGTRLGTLVPKPLTSIKNEKTILDFQIEKLSTKIGADNIYLVVGYKKEIIMEAYPNLIFIYNEAYAHTNTAKSLMLALKKIEDDVIWMNGDVYFDLQVLDLLLKSPSSACLVDTKKCGEEEIKYTVNNQGNIKELSKKVKNGLGEAVGINLIKKKDRKNFIEALEKVEQKDYFEKALENLTMNRKLVLKPINLGDLYCQEIDFEEDLEDVQNYLNKEKSQNKATMKQ